MMLVTIPLAFICATMIVLSVDDMILLWSWMDQALFSHDKLEQGIRCLVTYWDGLQ